MANVFRVGPGSTGTLTVDDSTGVAANVAIRSTSASGGIGYATGAGSTVTQITSRATGVTINAICGTITTDTTSLAAEASAVFVVTNSACVIGDVPVVAIRSGMVALNTRATVTAVAAGSFSITVVNGNVAAGTPETGAMILNFAIIKAVTA